MNSCSEAIVTHSINGVEPVTEANIPERRYGVVQLTAQVISRLGKCVVIAPEKLVYIIRVSKRNAALKGDAEPAILLSVLYLCCSFC